MLTKSGFIAAYERELSRRYDWTRNGEKLASVLDKVRTTILLPSGGGPLAGRANRR